MIREFLGKTESVPEEDIQNLAMKTLLKTEEVRMWIEHLLSVRKRRKCRLKRLLRNEKLRKHKLEKVYLFEINPLCCNAPHYTLLTFPKGKLHSLMGCYIFVM